jgi:hypothetical protein
VAGVSLVTPNLVRAQLFQPNAGVMIDSKGVLTTYSVPDADGQQMQARLQAAKATLNADVAKKSTLRKVSLTRLEKALGKQIADGRQPTEEMLHLAGLTRVQHVFLYPDSGDIVVAGPAEGWVSDLAGKTIGIVSGRPMIELQDLVVALRTFAPGGKGVRMIGCSIDATPEGLARMQAFLRSVGGQADPSNPNFSETIVNGLRTSLGLQKVRVDGVSPETHFAQVMVEADYRMKLIGIGLETPPVKIVSYVDRVEPGTVARNAMQRWWFVPDYKCVRVSEDQNAMELVGNGVKLLNEDEVVSGDGQRHVNNNGRGNRASTAFVTAFTQKYPELASKHHVFAELRNLIDLSIAAAFIQQQDYYGQAHWDMPIFSNEQKFAVLTCPAPVAVETAVGSKWKNNTLMTPVGGGVTLHPREALLSANLLEDDGGKVQKLHDQIDLKQLADGRWWWD